METLSSPNPHDLQGWACSELEESILHPVLEMQHFQAFYFHHTFLLSVPPVGAVLLSSGVSDLKDWGCMCPVSLQVTALCVSPVLWREQNFHEAGLGKTLLWQGGFICSQSRVWVPSVGI